MKLHMSDKHVTVLDYSAAEFHVKFTHVKHGPNVRSVCTLVKILLLSVHNLVAVCTIREFVLIYFCILCLVSQEFVFPSKVPVTAAAGAEP